MIHLYNKTYLTFGNTAKRKTDVKLLITDNNDIQNESLRHGTISSDLVFNIKERHDNFSKCLGTYGGIENFWKTNVLNNEEKLLIHSNSINGLKILLYTWFNIFKSKEKENFFELYKHFNCYKFYNLVKTDLEYRSPEVLENIVNEYKNVLSEETFNDVYVEIKNIYNNKKLNKIDLNKISLEFLLLDFILDKNKKENHDVLSNKLKTIVLERISNRLTAAVIDYYVEIREPDLGFSTIDDLLKHKVNKKKLINKLNNPSYYHEIIATLENELSYDNGALFNLKNAKLKLNQIEKDDNYSFITFLLEYELHVLLNIVKESLMFNKINVPLLYFIYNIKEGKSNVNFDYSVVR